MAEQTSRLAIILDSTKAKQNTDTLASSLERLTAQGEKATDSTDSLSFSFKRLASTAAGAMSIASVIKIADDWGQIGARMKNTLKSVEGDIKSYADIQERLLVISNRNGKNIEDSQLLYIGAATSMQELGYNTVQTVDYIESLSSSMTANASSANEVLSMQNALNKSMVAGKVAGENWNSIMNATPTLLGDIAKELERQNGGIKVTEMEVKKLASEGKISFKLFADAVMAAKDANNALADSMDNTVADGFKQLDGKFDKNGGEVAGNVTVKGLLTAIDSNGKAIQVTPTAIRTKTGTVWIDHVMPESGGTFMQVGDYGIGSQSLYSNIDNTRHYITGFRTFDASLTNTINKNLIGFCLSWAANGAGRANKVLACEGGNAAYPNWYSLSYTSNETVPFTQMFYTTANTTKDSNGNLKSASPIIRVFADHVDPNEEAEGVTLKKLHTGIYQLHGVLGLHSDASWGGINGGITIPCGINQLPLVYALYDVLEKGKPHPFDGRIVETDEDGDIVLYTSYRQHDLPQNIQYERFKLYPEFLRDATEGEESIPGFDGKVELTPGEPCDIPAGHWIDVRVNMPSNSIYNQKQAEAERLAKLEAERLAQEEAERVEQGAERAEQEAAEREQNEAIEN
ncbi:tape measure protein [Providencia rettgeri]|uniref:phage tail fiber protein n=1 Tax=Providencia rettgeri TaxID=587 RepID=UPI00300FD697